MLPSGLEKATSRIAFAAGVLRINVSVQAFAGPTLPGKVIGGSDQITRQASALVPENCAIHTGLIVHWPELAPHEERPFARRYEKHFLSWSSDEIVVPIALPEKADLSPLDVVGIVASEKIRSHRVTVLHGNPHLSLIPRRAYAVNPRP